MKIHEPQIIQEGGQTVYRAGVDTAKGHETLWYGVDEAFGGFVSRSGDAALVALLIPAMAAGEDIQAGGVVSERLLHNLADPVQRILQLIMPSLRRVAIRAEQVRPDSAARAPGVATGFSGGIDSYCVLADYHYANRAGRFKLTHLLFNNVGSHGSGGERLFRERYQRLAPVAERLGLPFLAIHSNLASFYARGFGFYHTHTLRNASVAFLLQAGIGRYLYASAYTYSDIFSGPFDNIAYSDPFTLPLLSTDTLDTLSVGGEYSRTEKTLRVAGIPDSHGTLDVCAHPEHARGRTNCSTCGKCLRTLATLEIAGCLDRYSTVFDLDAYRKQRAAYFAALLGSRDPLLREVVRFAQERHHPFPFSSRILHAAGLVPALKLAQRVARKLKRRPRTAPRGNDPAGDQK